MKTCERTAHEGGHENVRLVQFRIPGTVNKWHRDDFKYICQACRKALKGNFRYPRGGHGR
jgi:hypothetical protein